MVVSSGVSIDAMPFGFLSLYGPLYLSPPMRCALKYVGPLDSASGEKLLRSMAYLMSFEVIGEPSSYFRPFFRVYVHVFASALGLPSDSARSGRPPDRHCRRPA